MNPVSYRIPDSLNLDKYKYCIYIFLQKIKIYSIPLYISSKYLATGL
jgi:hypothetical protein